MDIQFSIHQELWQDAWIAATSAVRARKRQTDLNVQQRVERLLEEHGPKTSKPLTLRVYGTMIKGFCVINNDRARSLHADCERVVLLFAERPYLEGLQLPKLPVSKRQRVDAFTLDLDLTKVQEAEAFDWTQAPLGDSQLLSLDALPDPGAVRASALPEVLAPSLLEESGLLDEVFPSVDAPIVTHGAGPGALPLQLPDVATHEAPGVLEALHLEAPVAPGPGSEAADGASVLDLQHVRRTKRRRLLRTQPAPGHVFGFDVETQMLDAGLEVGLAEASPTLASFAAELRFEQFPSRMGLLSAIMDAPSSPLRPLDSLPHQLDGPGLSEGEHEELPEIQPLLGNVGDQLRPEMLGALFAAPPQGAAFLAAATEAADAATEALLELPEQARNDVSEGNQDVQTAQVGMLIRRYLTEQGESFLDDMMPPQTTDRSTAARAFSSLLALATGGGLLVQQREAYGPIFVSLC